MEPGGTNDVDWQNLSEYIPNTTGIKLKIKWYSLKKSQSQNNLWLKDEEDLLVRIINEHKKNNSIFKWTEISEKFNAQSAIGVVRLPKHCRERWMNYLNPELIKGDWTPDEDLLILETVLAAGRRWASVSKKLKGRTENSVKNRYLSLLSLHSSHRRKEKLSTPELKLKIEQKISNLKLKILERNEHESLLAMRSEAYLNRFPSEDFVNELSNENSQEKADDNKHVTFSEDVILNPAAILGKCSTKESFPLFSSSIGLALTGSGSNLDSNPNFFTYVEPRRSLAKPPSIICKNLSEHKIFINQNFEKIKKEMSLEEVSANSLNKGRLIEESLLVQKGSLTRSLSKSFSKLSMASSNKRSPLQSRPLNDMPTPPNAEQSSWSRSGQNFSSISSIGKKNDNIPKEHSNSSIISLSDVHMGATLKSFLEKSRSNDSSISFRERNLLMSAINNLKSEGSSIISEKSMKLKPTTLNHMMEEEKS